MLFILVDFPMLNLFIAIIVNAMHGCTDAEQPCEALAVETTREHIVVDLHAEKCCLRDEIGALKATK